MISFGAAGFALDRKESRGYSLESSARRSGESFGRRRACLEPRTGATQAHGEGITRCIPPSHRPIAGRPTQNRRAVATSAPLGNLAQNKGVCQRTHPKIQGLEWNSRVQIMDRGPEEPSGCGRETGAGKGKALVSGAGIPDGDPRSRGRCRSGTDRARSRGVGGTSAPPSCWPGAPPWRRRARSRYGGHRGDR